MTRRVGATMPLALLALALGTGPIHADAWVTPFQGHVSFGFGKLDADNAPGGSLDFAVGIDHPLTSTLRAGIDIDYGLLGTRTVARDSGVVVADVDFSALETLAMVHWQPSWRGPVGRLSGGVGVMAARAAVSTTAASEFQDLPVSEVAPAFAGEVTLIGRRPAPVRVGIETGVHVGLLRHQTWTVWALRLAIHY